jgi:hypothetical protein
MIRPYTGVILIALAHVKSLLGELLMATVKISTPTSFSITKAIKD